MRREANLRQSEYPSLFLPTLPSRLDKLIEIGSPPLGAAIPQYDAPLARRAGGNLAQLEALHRKKNGFYAFESALHVFPADAGFEGQHLAAWNDPASWRKEYADLDPGCLFFAENAFGFQFGLFDAGVIEFDPETGGITPIAHDIEGWATAVLDDYEYLTGYPVAHDWQLEHGPLALGKRLLPKQLFVMGGKFEPTNLGEVDAVSGMFFRGYVAQKIKDLPDGTHVQFEFPS